LDLPQDAALFLWVGRLTPVDKADLAPLIQAFHSVVQQQPNRKCLLLLVGGEAKPGYIQYLNSLVQHLGLIGKVEIRSTVPRSFIPLVFSAADVFVSPSDNVHENFGITPLEAMACGVPVIVSDWGGYKDTVLHGKTGFRIPTYWIEADAPLKEVAELYPWNWDHLHVGQSVAVDVPAMTQAMLHLLENDALRREMGEAARQHVEAHYAWPRIIRLHEALWAELSASLQGNALPSRDTYLKPHYFQVFGGYATAMLTPETELRLSRDGAAAAKGGLLLQPYPEIQGLIKPEALGKALLLMKGAGFLGAKRLHVGEFEEALEKTCGGPHEARLHLMWLLKYGFLEVSAQK
jgi:hypothetical protein